VASVIGSVGTEIYHRSINKGRRRLKGTFTTAPAAVGTPPVAAVPQAPRQIRWRRAALVAGGVFVLAMGALTVAELAAGRSVADVTRGSSGDRSTLSSILTDKSRSAKPTPAPSTSSTTPAPDPTATTATEPTTPASAEPTGTPTTEAPTGQPTATTGETGGSGTGGAGKGDSGAGGAAKGDVATPAPATTG
jgi:cytoskeletal protein RodZ